MSGASALTAEAAEIARTAALIEHPSLAAALVAALSDLTVVHAEREANAGSYSYKYADIGDVVKLTRPALARHGLVALTPVHAHGDGLACTVTILHTSGESWQSEPLSFLHGRDAQATGSAITYHRRYALVAALGMAAGDDDDGAAAKRTQPPMASGPSPSVQKVIDAIEKIDPEVKASIMRQAEGRSASPWADLIEDEGWRKWVTDAIDHHNAKGES